MPIISKETWEKFTQEEKEEIREVFQMATKNNAQGGVAEIYGGIFPEEALQPQPKIKVWSDVEREKGGHVKAWINTQGFIPDDKIQNKAIATLKIAKLIELGYGGMVTEEEWKDKGREEGFFAIWANSNGEIECTLVYDSIELIAFHKHQQAEEFMSYPDNIELLKQYYCL